MLLKFRYLLSKYQKVFIVQATITQFDINFTGTKDTGCHNYFKHYPIKYIAQL